MKLELKCDKCGKVGNPDQIVTDYDDRDLCLLCNKIVKLSELEEQYISKKQWLESTYLKDLKELESKISKLKDEIKN